MNKLAIAQKKESVAELVENLKKAKSYLLFEYHGMTARALGDLRKKMLHQHGKVLIFKNTMLERALKESGMGAPAEVLNGPNAIAFGFDDEIAPFKTVIGTGKDKKNLKVKAGYIDGKTVDAKTAMTLAELPSRTDLYAMIANMLMSPVASFARAVNAVAESKQEAPVPAPAPVEPAPAAA